MVQSFQFFRLHSVPSSLNDWTSKAHVPGSAQPRREEACVVCAVKDWLENRYPVTLFQTSTGTTSWAKFFFATGDEACEHEETDEEVNPTGREVDEDRHDAEQRSWWGGLGNLLGRQVQRSGSVCTTSHNSTIPSAKHLPGTKVICTSTSLVANGRPYSWDPKARTDSARSFCKRARGNRNSGCSTNCALACNSWPERPMYHL